jgi:prohibitin 2
VISAKGEAEAIRVRGEALRQSPSFLRWKIVERWNGRSPMVIPTPSEHNATGLLLPLSPAETPTQP